MLDADFFETNFGPPWELFEIRGINSVKRTLELCVGEQQLLVALCRLYALLGSRLGGVCALYVDFVRPFAGLH